MKICVSALAFALFIVACSSNSVNNTTDLELSNLQGQVWKIDRTNHSSLAGCVCPAALENECNQTLVIYNEAGNVAESYDIDADGDTINHSVYRYNKKGICTGIDKFSGTRLTGRQIPKFEKGMLSQVKVIDENGNHHTTYIYKHTDAGLSEIVTLNSDDDPVSKTMNEYKDGLLVSQTETDKSGNIKSTTQFKRNSHNDIIESIISISKDSLDYKILFEYEYDEMGNWVKQTKFYNGDIENVVLRNITYYESDASLMTEKL